MRRGSRNYGPRRGTFLSSGGVGGAACAVGDGRCLKVSPQQLQLPPNLADTPRTDRFLQVPRRDYHMDGQVGEILTALESTGKGNDTLVLFTSEQGSQFPGCKWTNWNTVCTPRWWRIGRAVRRWANVLMRSYNTRTSAQAVDRRWASKTARLRWHELSTRAGGQGRGTSKVCLRHSQ